jgi:hypothetical protein
VGELPLGDKIEVAAQFLYGYGFVTPFVFEYEKPTINCGTRDLEIALQVNQSGI